MLAESGQMGGGGGPPGKRVHSSLQCLITRPALRGIVHRRQWGHALVEWTRIPYSHRTCDGKDASTAALSNSRTTFTRRPEENTTMTSIIDC